jgi:aminodeoxyfutalosine synthase
MSHITFDTICEKVHSGRRLSAEEGLFLFRDDVDLHAVGELADWVRRRQNGDAAYYILNAHLNPTNVCGYRCELCAFSCDPNSDRAFVLSEDDMLERAQEAAGAGCRELHIVGGAHPNLPLDWYATILRRIHQSFPQLHLKAFTAVEIAWFAQISNLSIAEVLEKLMDSGLGSMPGGGAEIFDPAVRRIICPKKPDGKTWLEVHRAAHQLGLRTNATMLYGHVESAAQRIDHLVQLRQLQDETGGFQAFVPLAFHPENTRLGHLPKPTGMMDLRATAVSRLMLDNIRHIKAYWISLGVGTAQIALTYGADDLDGTVRHERIHHDAGAKSPEALSVDELRALIAETGLRPQERDAMYDPIHYHH